MRGQGRNNYDQHRCKGRYRSNSGDRYSRPSYRGRSQHGQNHRERSQYAKNDRGNFRGSQIYKGQNFRGGYRGSLRNSTFDRGRRRLRERQFLGNFRRNDTSSSRSRSGSRASTNKDRIRCLKCREYEHFAKDCPNMSETETDQT